MNVFYLRDLINPTNIWLSTIYTNKATMIPIAQNRPDLCCLPYYPIQLTPLPTLNMS